MASRSLDDLTPEVKKMALMHISACRAMGIELLIYCTLRTNEEQADLYAIGRTRPGNVVTNALPGNSLHNPDNQGKARAYDAVPTLAGKPQWDDTRLIGLMGVCGESVGLEWAGRWQGRLRESVHFQKAGV